MSSFETLRQRTGEGALRIIYVEGVPRSISTALSRALNEAEDISIYVHEPFNRHMQDIEATAAHLLETIQPFAETHPLTVVTKNISRYLTPYTFDKWTELCDSMAWCVRDPLVQMGSLVTRLANDLTHGVGSSVQTQEELTQVQFDQVTAHLQNSPHYPFSRTGWQAIDEHFKGRNNQPSRQAVIDGGRLLEDPPHILQAACNVLGLTFNDRMVDGWQNTMVDANVYKGARLETNAWKHHAATSIGMTAVDRAGLEVANLPEALQRHIVEVALPTYHNMTANNNIDYGI